MGFLDLTWRFRTLFVIDVPWVVDSIKATLLALWNADQGLHLMKKHAINLEDNPPRNDSRTSGVYYKVLDTSCIDVFIGGDSWSGAFSCITGIIRGARIGRKGPGYNQLLFDASFLVIFCIYNEYKNDKEAAGP
jgi:hypothetical protein